MKKLKCWIEAMRLRTLPVSVAGVVAGTACAIGMNGFRWLPALLCLLFALLSQIASNFANEYFDFRYGLDKKGREGFRRGVTEGDLSPTAMLRATLLTLFLACAVGCALIPFGGWWLIAVGVLVALFALAYSAGPYPLSHHGLGDIAVFIFFGLVPVNLTAWLQTGSWSVLGFSLPISVSIGLLSAMVLMVNNYRDIDDDRAVGKRTTAVIFGRKTLSAVYLVCAIVAVTIPLLLLFTPLTGSGTGSYPRRGYRFFLIFIIFYYIYYTLFRRMRATTGAPLNALLGSTAKTLFLFSIMLLFAFLRVACL